MPLSWQILPKMFQNEARCRLLPAEGGACMTSRCNGSDQNLSECPKNIACRYSLENTSYPDRYLSWQEKIIECYFRALAGSMESR